MPSAHDGDARKIDDAEGSTIEQHRRRFRIIREGRTPTGLTNPPNPDTRRFKRGSLGGEIG